MAKTATKVDAKAEDVGNILSMEHVNLTVSDQPTAILFYIVGMGFTRDPYMTVGLENMWINVGEQQFHLPTRPAQTIPGHIGIVVPNLDSLQQRLEAIAPRLEGTKFAWQRANGHVEVTCPWGNHYRCHAADSAFGGMRLGVPYVEFLTRPGTAAGIARFYEQIMGAPATLDKGKRASTIAIGTSQTLRFQETDDDLPAYDGHHIAVYVADFSRPYRFLQEHELLTEEIQNHQFRFQDLPDPESGDIVFTVEHEVRGFRHPMYRRPLVNRNAEQNQRSYQRGADAFIIQN